MAKNIKIQQKSEYSLTLRGSIWHARLSFKTEDGKRIQFRETTGTSSLERAEEYCKTRISQLRKKETVRQGGLIEMSLDEAFGRYIVEKGNEVVDQETRIARLKKMKDEFNVRFLSDINDNIINDFISKHKKTGNPVSDKDKLSNATINRYISLLSTVFTIAKKAWKVRIGDVDFSMHKLQEPAVNVKYVKNWEILNKIISKAAEHLKPIIYTGIYTGLRQGNILRLKWENIDFDARTITLKVKSRRYKGGKVLTLPIADKLYDILLLQPKINEFVFNYRGKPIKSIDSAWLNIFYNRIPIKHKIKTKKGEEQTVIRYEFIRTSENLKDKNIPYINFHTIRHTTATWILKKTNNLKTTQETLGHEDIRTTLKYAHVLDEEKRKAVNLI